MPHKAPVDDSKNLNRYSSNLATLLQLQRSWDKETMKRRGTGVGRSLQNRYQSLVTVFHGIPLPFWAGTTNE